MANLFILPSDAIVDLDHVIAIVRESLLDEDSQICFQMTSGLGISSKSSSSDNAAKVKLEAYRHIQVGNFDRLGARDTSKVANAR
jgi:hypothetical protein